MVPFPTAGLSTVRGASFVVLGAILILCSTFISAQEINIPLTAGRTDSPPFLKAGPGGDFYLCRRVSKRGNDVRNDYSGCTKLEIQNYGQGVARSQSMYYQANLAALESIIVLLGSIESSNDKIATQTAAIGTQIQTLNGLLESTYEKRLSDIQRNLIDRINDLPLAMVSNEEAWNRLKERLVEEVRNEFPDLAEAREESAEN